MKTYADTVIGMSSYIATAFHEQ